MPSLLLTQCLLDHKVFQTLLKKCDLSQFSKPIRADELRTVLAELISERHSGPEEKARLNALLTDSYMADLIAFLVSLEEPISADTQKTIVTNINRDLQAGEAACHIKQADTSFIRTYLAILPFVKQVAENEEGTQQKDALAYKLAALFKDEESVVQYLEHFTKKYKGERPLHDATLFNLPSFDKMAPSMQEAWHRLAKKYLGSTRRYDVRFIELLNFADKLTALKAALPSSIKDFQMILLSLKDKSADSLSRIDRVMNGIEEKAKQDYKRAEEKAVLKALGKLKKEASDTDKKHARENAIIAFQTGPSSGLIKGIYKQYIASLDTFSLEQLTMLTQFCGYERATEYPDAADILLKMKVPELFFNQYLDLLKKSPPQSSDNLLPPVCIDGADVGCEGFYLVKLSANDPKSAFLGYPTGCCQSIGSLGATCAVYGVTEKNSGFYVLCRGRPPDGLKEKMLAAKKAGRPLDTTHLISSKSIVAQSWVWRTYENARLGYSNVAVLDNIEASQNLGIKNIPKLFRLYMLLSKELIQESKEAHPIESVYIGIQSGVRGLGYQAVDEPEHLSTKVSDRLLIEDDSSDREPDVVASAEVYRGYSDAEDQYVILEKKHPVFLALLSDETFEKGLAMLKAHEADSMFFAEVCCFLPSLRIDEAKKIVSIIKAKKVELCISFFNFLSSPDLLQIMLEELLDLLDFDAVNALDQNDDTFMHAAFIYQDTFRILLSLLPTSVFFNAISKGNHKGESVLHRACENLELMTLMLSRLSSENKIKALKLVARSSIRSQRSRLSVFRVLFKFPRNLEEIFTSLLPDEQLSILKDVDSRGNTAWHHLIKKDDALRGILSVLSDEQILSLFDLRNRYDEIALHHAAIVPDSFKLLLNYCPKGRHFDWSMAENKAGETVLFLASKNTVSLQYLFSFFSATEKAKALSMKNKKGQGLFHVSAKNAETVAYLLSLYDSKDEALTAICSEDDEGKTALHYTENSTESLTLLLSVIAPDDQEVAVMHESREGVSVLDKSIAYPKSLQKILSVIKPENRFSAVTRWKSAHRSENCCSRSMAHSESLAVIMSSLREENRLKALTIRTGSGQTPLETVGQYPDSFEVIIPLIPDKQRYRVLRVVSENWMNKNINYQGLSEKTGSPLLKLIADVLGLNKIMSLEKPGFFSASSLDKAEHISFYQLCSSGDVVDSYQMVFTFLSAEPRDRHYKTRLLNRLVLSAKGDVAESCSDKLAFLERTWQKQGVLQNHDTLSPKQQAGQ